MLLSSMASMIVVTVAHRSIKIVNKLLRLRIVGFVTLLSSDRIINCYQVLSRHHVEVRVLPADIMVFRWKSLVRSIPLLRIPRGEFNENGLLL